MASLLDEAIEAHGGRRRWQRAREIRAHVSGGGMLMRSKFKHRQFSDYGISVSTTDQSAVIEPYPRPGQTGVFAGGSVRILDADGGVVKDRENAREAFSGVSGVPRKLRWDDLDALYFAGYAIWNYMATPFLFEWPGFEATEAEPIDVDGERWRRLDVRFPEAPGFHAHCRDQSFYFDQRCLLRRNDYSPDVISPHANAAHLCGVHREFDGIVFPTSRRVVPKGPGGRLLPGPTIVSLELDSISVS
jgi:hypothetical protein